ncbi:MAG: putative ABC transporter permease [Atopobiaceae bacterium]|jgi:uncharacterized membrane protein|nr:putative ABC transporter permease [Atopobiaceae bacterium]
MEQTLGKDRQRAAKGKLPPLLRFLMVMYVITIVLSLVILMATSRDDITYGVGFFSTVIDVIFYGASAWLVFKRMKAAVPVIVAIGLIDVAVSFVEVAMGTTEIGDAVFGTVITALLTVYFLTSKKVKALMTNSFTDEDVEDRDIPTMKDPVFWRNLVLYYCVFSILGHWMEAGFCMLIRAGVVAGSYDPSNTSLWRDWLYPFPPDGVGFVMCVLVLYPFKNWLQKHMKRKWLAVVPSFVVNALVCTLVELCFGLVVNTHFELWNYSDMAFNFMGQICLQNGIGFGIASTVITWSIYPFLANQIAWVPKKVMSFVFVAFILFYAMLQSLYLINL